jgi:hypothetical protein
MANRILLIVVLPVIVSLSSIGMISNLGMYAQGYTYHVKDGESQALFCPYDFGIASDSVELKPGESKTVGCKSDADFNLGYLDARVFWCNHDHPLVLASHDGITEGSTVTVECAK